MRRRLVVHVGTVKTGSTSIQQVLHRLPLALERAGVHVPVAASWRGRAANLVGTWHPILGGWEDLLYEVQRSPARLCVISNDLFTYQRDALETARRIEALARAAGRDVEVVGYVRPQYQFVESLYVENVRGGSAVPFEPQLRTMLLDHSPADYETCFRSWREVFGERLAVYPLEATRIRSGLIAHFLSLLGADDVAPAAAALRPANTRLGAKHVEVLRLTRLALDGRALDERTRFALERVRQRTPALLDGDRRFAGLSLSQVRTVTEHFAASNARFAREYGIDPGGVLFREAVLDTTARPCRAEWHDFSPAERRRVREMVLEEVGMDLAPGCGSGRRSAHRPGGRVSTSGGGRRALAHRINLIRKGTRVLGPVIAAQVRCVRSPSDLPAFLRWLRWEIEWACRRAVRAMTSAPR